MNTETEICCFSYHSALLAHQASVTRIELCGGFAEGGTTPSNGLIKCVLESVSPNVYTMIRPRGGDFVYSESEILTIYSEIEEIKKLNPSGFVFGALTRSGEVDLELCKNVIEWASPFPVTFHRAFDYCTYPFMALEQIIDLGFERILTSGQQTSALAGIQLLQGLTERAEGRIQIMAGAGVNESNAIEFIRAGIPAIHFTLKEWQPSLFKTERGIPMGTENLPDGQGHYETSKSKLDVLIQKIGKK